ncbi:MAG: SDR family oxidoreductase [Limisphaerales bacterium]
MDLNLGNHVVVITGGASGIGHAAAELFAGEGCKVALWDVTPGVGEIARELSVSRGVPTLGCPVDVTRRETIEAALQATETQLGPIDHVVHSAAIGSGKFGFPFTNLTPADWPRVLEVNVMGMTNLAHAVAPRLIGRKQGTLVFIASVAGQIGSQTDPPYSASKAANINFAQCLAKDLAPHGVRVNTVCPGMVKTPLNESVWRAWHDQQPPGKRLGYEEWAAGKIRAVVPLGRWQSPGDIANMVVFLSSDRAAQITGQTLNVDGGFVMHW